MKKDKQKKIYTNETIGLLRQYWNIAKPFWLPELENTSSLSSSSSSPTTSPPSPVRHARILLTLLIVLAVSSTSVYVRLSFLEKQIINSLASKDPERLTKSVFENLFFILFACILFSSNSYVENSLEILWRKWLTNSYLHRYLFLNKSYFHLNFRYHKEVDNPDQRITEDVSVFTDKSLKYLVIFLNNSLKLFAFSGVLFSISPNLLVFLLFYTSIATFTVIRVFGSKLVTLNFLQSKFNANFRSGLIHVRENSESIAFYGGESEEYSMLWKRLTRAMDNLQELIYARRNLAFCQNLFELLASVLPVIFVAPLYFSGAIELGSVTQAAAAFQKILSALGLIIDKLDTFSSFTAGVERLEALRMALEEIDQKVGSTTQEEGIADTQQVLHLPHEHIITKPGTSVKEEKITTLIRDSTDIGLDNLTVITPASRVLISGLSVMIEKQQSMLIMGASGNGKSSLLRVIAGLWNDGQGRVTRPSLRQMFFLPQRPYMTLGSLRTNLLYPSSPFEYPATDDQLYEVLKQVNLGHVVQKLGGLEVDLDLAHILSLGEQQRLAFARILVHKPPIVLIDEATSALDEKNEENLYRLLNDLGVTVVSIGHRSTLLKYHTILLELLETGWNLKKILPNEQFNSTPPFFMSLISSSFPAPTNTLEKEVPSAVPIASSSSSTK